MKRFDLRLYPELRSLDERDRDSALREARREPFDLVELLGMAAAVVLVTSVTRYSAQGGFLEQFSMGIANFLIALPLLAVAVGPFLHRRTRRGLHAVLRLRMGREPEAR